MAENPQEFDLSNMDKYKDDTNHNTLGRMKSEVGEGVILEWCALNPKCYSYRYLEKSKVKENKKAKGISMPVVDKTMEFSDYRRVCETNNPQTRPIYNIRSFNQSIFTTLEDKQALSPFYDKMLLLNATDCCPYGFNPA